MRIAKWIERFFGRLSDGNLCVTCAMKDWLKQEWDIDASVLYDRAPQSFHRASLKEKHALFSKLPIENMFTEKSSLIEVSDNETKGETVLFLSR